MAGKFSLTCAQSVGLTGDHFVGKLSAEGLLTMLNRPSIPPGW